MQLLPQPLQRNSFLCFTTNQKLPFFFRAGVFAYKLSFIIFLTIERLALFRALLTFLRATEDVVV